MFKRLDYIIIAIICFLAGILLVSNIYSAKNFKKVVNSENNEVMAVEVSKLTKSNAELREQVKKLTLDLDTYKNQAESDKNIVEKFSTDTKNLDSINGAIPLKGQGVIINVSSRLNLAEIVDLINAIKNIGSSEISINQDRLILNTDLGKYTNLENCQVKVIGNSKLLQSALDRKGGIVEQLRKENVTISVSEADSVDLPAGSPIQFIYSSYIIK